VREHSRLELERKLAARGHERAAVGDVLDGLAGRGLLSEARMAEGYVAERLRKGFGPVRIRHELRERGIPDALIDPHLQRSAQEWLALMARVNDKKFGPGPRGDRKELARRARFLEYRGFPAELIGRFLHGDDAL
jgi:regulatory protein